MGRKFRVGMIGAGGIASGAHAGGWMAHPDVEVYAVCDVDEKRAGALAEKVGAPHTFTDFKKMVKLKELDAVDVCTPNKIHTPAVLASLSAGKHVVCEKPLAVSVQEVLKMGRLAEQKKLKLMTAQHQRWTSMGIACKQFLGTNGLGSIYHARVNAVRRNLLPGAPGFIDHNLSGGGPCMDIGVHALDLTMWLMNFPKPVRVSGTTKVNFAQTDIIPGEWGEWDRKRFSVEDFAAGFIHFDNGATMSLESCWIAHTANGEDMSGQVSGTGGTIRWPDGVYYSAQNRINYDVKLTPPSGLKGAHTAELHAFYDCVTNKTPSPVPYTETVKVIAILESIYKSAAQGREVKVSI